MSGYNTYFTNYLIELGLSHAWALFLNMLILLAILLIIILIIDTIVVRILKHTIKNISQRTKTKFDDFLVLHKAPQNVAHLVPLILSFKLLPIVFKDFLQLEALFLIILKICAILLIIRILRSVLKSLGSYFKTLPSLKDKPIDSYIQIIMLFIWIIGVASGLAVLINLSFFNFFTTLGAASAILLLIFKDTILGFVASIQVAINDTLRIGDWITMDKFGADGYVIEINLSTVLVQNFDKTITSIPTYAIISESFKNWRGMQASGGRRIKRSIFIKPKSIHYLTDSEIKNLKKIQLIKDYIENRSEEIKSHNRDHNIDKTIPINGRHLTNLGVFRKYAQTYIENHPGVHKDMTMMVRQLAPTPHGIPLEIYAFSNDIRWVIYENISSDIFDHLISAMPYFNLKVFELATSDLHLTKD